MRLDDKDKRNELYNVTFQKFRGLLLFRYKNRII